MKNKSQLSQRVEKIFAADAETLAKELQDKTLAPALRAYTKVLLAYALGRPGDIFPAFLTSSTWEGHPELPSVDVLLKLATIRRAVLTLDSELSIDKDPNEELTPPWQEEWQNVWSRYDGSGLKASDSKEFAKNFSPSH